MTTYAKRILGHFLGPRKSQNFEKFKFGGAQKTQHFIVGLLRCGRDSNYLNLPLFNLFIYTYKSSTYVLKKLIKIKRN